mgnify:CR=1 FL=1
MKRPLKEARPVGPFVESSGDRVSEFDSIEVERNESTDDANYTITGVRNPGRGSEDIGLVVDTDAITLNGETGFALDKAGATATFIGSSGVKVAITDRSSSLVNINTR